MILNKGKVAREMILKKEKITARRNDTCLSLAFVYGGTTRHTPRQSRLHGVLAQKKTSRGPAFSYVTQTLF